MKLKTVANQEVTNHRYKSLGTWTESIVIDENSEVIDKGNEMVIRNCKLLTRKEFENGKVCRKVKMILIEKPSIIIEKAYGWNFEEKEIEVEVA